MLGLERLAEPAEKGLHFVGGLLHVRSSPTRRGGWIVQFVGQTRSHCAERSELFPLLRVAFQVPHPVCSRAKNLTRDCLAGDKHPPKALFTKPEQASRLGHTERRNPRDVQQQHRLAEIASRFVNAQKDGLTIIDARGANFAFEEDMKKPSPFSFRGQSRAERRFDYFPSVQASELVVS